MYTVLSTYVMYQKVSMLQQKIIVTLSNYCALIHMYLLARNTWQSQSGAQEYSNQYRPFPYQGCAGKWLTISSPEKRKSCFIAAANFHCIHTPTWLHMQYHTPCRASRITTDFTNQYELTTIALKFLFFPFQSFVGRGRVLTRELETA